MLITKRFPVPNVQPRVPTLVRIKQKSKKVLTASQLPVVVNLNPRSIYNKKNEYRTMMEQLEVDCCFISESWDRDNNSLEQIISMEGYQIVKNVMQRTGKGGKPALMINKDKYFIKELCPSVFTVPATVEATWAVLTPKNQVNSEVKHIALASIYYAKRTKSKDIIDHICEAYNVLMAKYGEGLHFIIAGDYNRLNIKPILNLSPSLSQVVNIVTRTNPDATLDKIITTLSKFYLPPVSLPPLDNDEPGNGKPSDHLIIVWKPISQLGDSKPKQKEITFRPLPESGMLAFKLWLQNEPWNELYQSDTAHRKAELFYSKLLKKLDQYLPQKKMKIRSDDREWINSDIKSIDRRRKREYNKHKRSAKWEELDQKFQQKCEKAKINYAENIVNDLKHSDPSQWYSKLKRMSSHFQEKDQESAVQELIGLSDCEQAEIIADQFSEVSNLYNPLATESIKLDTLCDDRPPPEINPYLIYLKIMSIKKKTSTLIDDIPMKLIQFCAEELSFPLSDIYTRAIIFGEYPDIYKLEIVTPVPKVYPVQTTRDLRKIAGTKNFSRIFEMFLSEIMIEDMKLSRDMSQYGNCKGVSTQHYLIRMIDNILTHLDKNNKNEVNAVLVQLVDWSQAFDRQCPLLGIQSFIKNGVRKSIIPVLISFFQERKMRVKWRKKLSSVRHLPEGGPQGSSVGLIEFDSQSNDNAEFLSDDDKFKFVDDLSVLEIINLILIGLSSYNFKQHVASDIGIGQLYLPTENIKSQGYMNNISQWTQDNKMKLNERKTKVMIFNYSRNYQFATRIHLNNTLLDTIRETRLLGTVISDDLSWQKNSQYLIQRGYTRMTILRNLYQFNIPEEDLVLIYCLYIRSVLEYNSSVWFSSITQEESNDIERVQRCACRIILKDEYVSYESALSRLNLQNLSDRRKTLALRFAQKCTTHERFENLFPLNDKENLNLRNPEKHKVKFARTLRLCKSSIPAMQRLLNQ